MSLVEITSPIALKPDAIYYAKLQLTGAEDAFGGAPDVADQFSGLGFKDVSVWTTAPAIFPDRSPYAGGSTYWARGIYSGPAKTVGLPVEIKRAWVDTGDQPAPSGGYTPPPDFVGPPEPGWNWPIAPTPTPTPDNPTPPSETPATSQATKKSPLPALILAAAAAWLAYEILYRRRVA